MSKKQNIQDLTFDPEFNGRPIMTDKSKGQSCRKRILQKIDDNLNYMTDNHSKVFFIRFDARFPKEYNTSNNNKVYTDFEANFKRNLQRKGLDPHTVWVREQSREKHQHYHGILLLDGQKTQAIHNHIATAEKLWGSALGLEPDQAKGLIDNCTKSRDGSAQRNGIMLRRDDPEYDQKVNEAFHWASYLAKDNTKHNTPDDSRAFGGSSVKPRRKSSDSE